VPFLTGTRCAFPHSVDKQFHPVERPFAGQTPHGIHGKVIATAGEAAVAPQANCALRTMAGTVPDGVGDGFSGGDDTFIV
jgi:hypothetical protein